MSDPRDHALFARYLDGLATEAEGAELGRRLAADPACARAFAEASRLDASLGAHFRQEKGQSDVRAVLQRIQAGRTRRRIALFAATAAAALLIVLTPALWLRPAAPPVEVLAGNVVADGAEVTRIAYGVRFIVPGSGQAPLTLGDGSGASLDGGTAAAIHGPSGPLRQAVELFSGGGDFRVLKDTGRFEVRTPVGLVTVLGTEFTVRLRPRKPTDGRGDEAMRAKGMLLAVAVLTGAVQVQVGERAVVLGVGQSQVFAGDEERGPRTSRIGGELAAVGADSITIVQRGERGETTKTLAVDAQTKVVIESDQTEQVKGERGEPTYRVKLVDGTLGDLKVGRRVTVTCTEDGKATLIVLHRAKPRREGGEGEGERTPRVEKPRREGGDREGEKPRREGGEGDREGEPRREKVRTEGGDREGEARPDKPRREGGEGEREKPRREGGDSEGEGKPRVEKPRREGGDSEGEARPDKPRREGGEGERAPKPRVTPGILVGVKADSIVVRVGERGEQTLTFAVDAATEVAIEGVRLEGGGEGADPIKRPALIKGSLGDLKAGQRVSVQATADGKALKIFIHRSQAPKREGEGERKHFRPPDGGERKPPREGGDRKPPREGEAKPPREGGDAKPPVVDRGAEF